MGCICRDHNGRLTDGFSSHFTASSALQAEIQALTLTLNHLIRQGFTQARLLLESDSFVLVDTLNHRKKPPWDARSLFEEAAALLSLFSNLTLCHCRWEANVAADWASKALNRDSTFKSWTLFPPSQLVDLICADALAAGCTGCWLYIYLLFRPKNKSQYQFIISILLIIVTFNFMCFKWIRLGDFAKSVTLNNKFTILGSIIFE